MRAINQLWQTRTWAAATLVALASTAPVAWGAPAVPDLPVANQLEVTITPDTWHRRDRPMSRGALRGSQPARALELAVPLC